jgi:hypothetical protein
MPFLNMRTGEIMKQGEMNWNLTAFVNNLEYGNELIKTKPTYGSYQIINYIRKFREVFFFFLYFFFLQK